LFFFFFWESYQGYRKRAQLFALITAELEVLHRGGGFSVPPLSRCSLSPPSPGTPFPESEDCSWPLLTFVPAQVLENIFKFSSVAISQSPRPCNPPFTVVPPSHLSPTAPLFILSSFFPSRHKHIMYSIWVRVLCAQLHFY